MRTIKFRAWDKTAKLMCNVLELHFPNEDGSGVTTDNYQGSFERFELMRYTGLKDKNGKEIYEGDIVRHNGKLISEIYFDEDDAGFKLRNKTMGKLHSDKNFFADNIEVIGNICEIEELNDRKTS